MNDALGCAELIATQNDGHAAGNLGQKQRLLASRIAATDHKHLLAAEEHAVARCAIRNATTSIRILADKTSRTRRGTHASNDASSRRITRVVVNGKQSIVDVVIDARYHAPCNLSAKTFCMLLKTLTQLGTAQQRNTRVVLDFIRRGDLSTRHALLKDRSRKVGAGGINSSRVSCRTAANNRNIDRLFKSHYVSSRRSENVLCAHTQI